MYVAGFSGSSRTRRLLLSRHIDRSEAPLSSVAKVRLKSARVLVYCCKVIAAAGKRQPLVPGVMGVATAVVFRKVWHDVTPPLQNLYH